MTAIARTPSGPKPRKLAAPRSSITSPPRAPKPASPALARRQLVHLEQLDELHPLKHELRDTHSPRHGDRLRAEVDHRDHELAAIVGIDGGGGVGEGKTVLHG